MNELISAIKLATEVTVKIWLLPLTLTPLQPQIWSLLANDKSMHHIHALLTGRPCIPYVLSWCSSQWHFCSTLSDGEDSPGWMSWPGIGPSPPPAVWMLVYERGQHASSPSSSCTCKEQDSQESSQEKDSCKLWMNHLLEMTEVLWFICGWKWHLKGTSEYDVQLRAHVTFELLSVLPHKQCWGLL